MPEISVVMPVYNAEKYLKESIESILNQSFTELELIIIDDGSTDKSPEIIKRYAKKDRRIRVYTQENKGAYSAKNRGIENAKGEYIAVMDADDISLPHRLMKQHNAFEEDKNLWGCGTWANIINEKGRRISTLKPPTKHSEIKEKLAKDNLFISPSIMFRKKIFDEKGLFSEKYRFAEDYEFLLRTVREYRINNIPEILYDYRITGDGITRKWRKKQAMHMIKSRFKAVTEYGYPKKYLFYSVKQLFTLMLPTKLLNHICDRRLKKGRDNNSIQNTQLK